MSTQLNTQPPREPSEEEVERAFANPSGLNYWVHQLKDCIRFQLWSSLRCFNGDSGNRQFPGRGGGLENIEVRIFNPHDMSRETMTAYIVFLLRRLADEIEAKAGKFTDSRNVNQD